MLRNVMGFEILVLEQQSVLFGERAGNRVPRRIGRAPLKNSLNPLTPHHIEQDSAGPVACFAPRSNWDT
jgi:hypothetical protein